MLKYSGSGFITGVPARDLTEDEVKQYGERRLIASGLYYKPIEKKQLKRRDYQPVIEEKEDDTGY